VEDRAIIVLGVGPRERVMAARQHVERRHGPALATAAFELGDERIWALRVQRAEVTKGSAIEHVATRLGYDLRDCAAIGDWYNDVPMFERVSRSFAMGHAPEPVRRAATDVLRATAETGGGIAEALRRWDG